MHSAGRSPIASVRVLLIVAASMLMTQGCGAAMLSSMSWGSRPEKLSVGAGKEDVQAELGRPIASQATPDGGRIDSYEFRVYEQGEGLGKGFAKGAALIVAGREVGLLYLLGNVLTFGAPEVAITVGYGAYKLATHPRSQVKVAFGSDDRIAWIATAPRYGPPDDALVPSIGAIRQSCWGTENGEPPAPHPGGSGETAGPSGDPYVNCVARRFAIWGIE